MDELLATCCVLTIVVPVVTLVGHGLWVFFAFLFRGGKRKTPAQVLVACGQCGKETDAGHPQCNWCRQDWRPRTPTELDDLAALERQVARLVRGELLQPSAAEEILATAQAYRRRLEATSPPPVPEPIRQQPAPIPSRLGVAGDRLEELLRGYPHIAEETRRRALAVHDATGADDLARLPAAVQFDLARLLVWADRVDDAIRAYRRILKAYPKHPGCVQTALEAARLGLRHDRLVAVRFFLDEAAPRNLTAAQRRDAEALEQQLAARCEVLGETLEPARLKAWETAELPTSPFTEGATAPAALSDHQRAAAEAIPAAPDVVPAVLASPEESPVPIVAPAITGQQLLVDGGRAASAMAPPTAPTPLAASAAPGAPAAPVHPLGEPAPPRSIAEILPSVSEPPAAAMVQMAPAEPRAPRRSLAEILAGFMEEKNIRWGELVGGLLIVGCSIMLVVSLWEQLQRIEYYQLFIYVSITSAVFGAGLYTYHRWKLQSTSRGLLIIATLLVPLTFLAMVGTSKGTVSLAGGAAEALGLGVFVLLVGQAAKILAPHARWWAVLTIVGNSAVILAIPRFIHPESRPLAGDGLPWVFLLLAVLPVLLHVAANAAALRWVRRQQGDDGQATADESAAPATPPAVVHAHAIFVVLGTSSFALAVALALAAARCGNISQSLPWLAPLAVLAVSPALAAGLTVMHSLRLAEAVPNGAQPHAAASGPAPLLASSGSVVVLLGAVAMLVAVGMAWPHPASLLVVGLLSFTILALVAVRYEFPALHGTAVACLAVGYITAAHWVLGMVSIGEPYSRRLFSEPTELAQTGVALVGLFVILGACAELVARSGVTQARRHGGTYATACGIVAAISLLLVTLGGFFSPGEDRVLNAQRATWVYAAYGLGALVINVRWRRPAVTYGGLGLLVAASLWGLWRWQDPAAPLHAAWGATLAIEALLLGLAGTWLTARWQPARAASPRGPQPRAEPLAADSTSHQRSEVEFASTANQGAEAPQTLIEGSRGEPPALSLSLKPGTSSDAAYARPLSRAARLVAPLGMVLGVWSGCEAADLLALLKIVPPAGGNPWHFAHLVTGLALFGVYLTIGLAERASALLALSALMLGGAATAASGWWASQRPDLWPLAGLSVAAVGAIAALVSAWGSRYEPRAASRWGVVVEAWPPMALLLTVIAVALSFVAPGLESRWPGATGGVLAAALVALAVTQRRQRHVAAPLAWVASALALGACVHWFVWVDPQRVRNDWSVALLAHASGAVFVNLLIGLYLARLRPRTAGKALIPSRAHWLREVLAEPIGSSGIITSLASLPLLVDWQRPLAVSQCLFWLAGLWLVVSLVNRWVILFSGFQAVLFAAVAFLGAWYYSFTWNLAPRDIVAAQACATWLAGLCVLWIALRIGLKKAKQARRMLNPPWPAVDRVVFGVLLAGQLLLIAVALLPGIGRELAPARNVPVAMVPLAVESALGPQAWLLAGALAAVVVLALWQRLGAGYVLASVTLVVTVPLLLSGQFQQALATASAVRWLLAGTFAICAALIWMRSPIQRGLLAAGSRLKLNGAANPAAQALLLVLSLPTILLPSGLLAMAIMTGSGTAGPIAGFFDGLRLSVNGLVPLAIVTLALVGFALRERSPGYAFGAGLVANLVVTVGYALSITRFDTLLPFAQLVQLSTTVAAVWGLLWLVSRKFIDTWKESPDRPTGAPLMILQLALAVLGNAALLGPALASLVFLPPAADWQHLPHAAGTELGWVALLATCAAVAYREWTVRRQIRPLGVAVGGMTILALLACTLQRLAQPYDNGWWGYRALMLGWAMYALVIVLATWWVAAVRTGQADEGPPRRLIRLSTVWMLLAGFGAVLLALWSAVIHTTFHETGSNLVWAALALGLVAAAQAATAIWHRAEGWAFAAGLLGNFAASLAVWWYYFDRQGVPFELWWTTLVQANIAASAAAALLWLAARRRLVVEHELGLRPGPLLALQVALGLAGSVLLLVLAAVWLVQDPVRPGTLAVQLGKTPGWLGLVLSCAAASWCGYKFARRTLPYIVGLALLGVALLAACYVAGRWNTDWSAARAAIIGLSSAALLTMLAGRVPIATRLLGQAERKAISDPGQTEARHSEGGEESAARPEPAPAGTSQDAGISRLGSYVSSFIPQASSFKSQALALEPEVAWVAMTLALLVAIAIRGALVDPAQPGAALQTPWWAGAVAAASAILIATALAYRQAALVAVSALLFNVGGTIWYLNEHVVDSWPKVWNLLLTNVVCFAGSSAVWSLLAYLPWRNAAEMARRSTWPRLASQLGLALLAGLAVVGVTGHLMQEAQRVFPKEWGWAAWTSVALAIILRAAARSLQPVWPGVYGVGLLGVGMGLLSRRIGPTEEFIAAAVLALAAYVLAAVVVGRLAIRLHGSGEPPVLNGAGSSTIRPVAGALANGFVAGQVAFAALIAAVCVWMSLDLDRFNTAWLRMAPAGAMVFLLAASVALGGAATRYKSASQNAALVLGAVTAAAIGLALVHRDVGWLNRSAVLMLAAAAVIPIYAIGLPRCLPETSHWVRSGRRLLPVLCIAAGLLLVVMHVQEIVHFERPDGTRGAPMARSVVFLAAAFLAALFIAGIVMAVVPKFDPWKLSERGRQVYVYAAELAAGLIWLHLYLCIPKLFEYGIMEKYWTLIVMAIAYGGAALAELFHRRKMPILAEPLINTAFCVPFVPVLLFQIIRLVDPDNRFLIRLTTPYWMVLFMAGVFYGVMGHLRKSLLAGALSGVAMMTGYWAFLMESNVAFAAYPHVWLIPAALVVLVAEYLNHQRLTAQQSGTVRYLALGVIYLSTTVDMFMEPLAKSMPWGALLLMGLSIAGVLAGIVLRVRSFLLLGVLFLCIDLVTMIKYAAVDLDHTWVLWASGVVAGALILALFAYFEKRRNDVRGIIDKLKAWER